MLSAVAAFPQNAQDSVAKKAKGKVDNEKAVSVSELFAVGEKTFGGNKSSVKGHYFKGHWKGYYFGFMDFANLPSDWEDLKVDMASSFSMQFNFARYSVNLNKRGNFGLLTGLGLEYQRLLFSHAQTTLAKVDGEVVVMHTAFPDNDHTRRSVFKNFYLTAPLLAEVQFPAEKKPTRQFYVSGGVMAGVRMHSKTKVVYEDVDGDKHKAKGKGNFNVVPFKVDALLRVGFSSVTVWGSYGLTNLFKGDSVPSLHVYAVGFGVSF